MLKMFGLTLVLSTTTFVFSGTALSDTQSNVFDSDHSNQMGFDETSLFCYMQTRDGRVLNLTQLCGGAEDRSSPTPATTASVNISPGSNLGGLQRVAETTGCFGLDDQGRLCPTVP